jgi:hypothetical protein
MSDRLNDLLRAWRRTRELEPADADALARRVAASLAAEPDLDPRPVDRRRRTWAWLAAAAAVVIAVAGVAVRLLSREDVASLALLPDARLRASAAVFRGVEELFGDRCRWVVESPGDVQIGVSPADEADSPPLALRLVVISRPAGSSTWKVAWERTFLARSESSIDVADGDRRVCAWIYRLPDGLVAVDASLDVDLPAHIDSSESGILKPSTPRCVLELEAGGVTYRVLHAVQELGKGASS